MSVDYRPPPLTEARIRRAIEEERVMDSGQVAELLEVKRITVRTLVAKKELRTIRPGIKPLLFLEDEVRDLKDRRDGLEMTRP